MPYMLKISMPCKIKILAENYAYKTQFAEWGFSVFIDFNGTQLLFDTGQSGDCVLKNAKTLNTSLENIDAIILSHGHYDHTGGLNKILKAIGNKKIFAHKEIFTKRSTLENGKKTNSNPFLKYKNFFLSNNYPFVFCDEIVQIKKDLYLIGNVPITNSIEKISDHFIISIDNIKAPDTFNDELHLVLDLPQGLLIITGCAHRGLINIATHIKNTLNKNIFGIMGGTHLYEANHDQLNCVVNFIKKENIQFFSPSHCTGMENIFTLKNIFPDIVFPSFCGSTFTLG